MVSTYIHNNFNMWRLGLEESTEKPDLRVLPPLRQKTMGSEHTWSCKSFDLSFNFVLIALRLVFRQQRLLSGLSSSGCFSKAWVTAANVLFVSSGLGILSTKSSCVIVRHKLGWREDVKQVFALLSQVTLPLVTEINSIQNVLVFCLFSLVLFCWVFFLSREHGLNCIVTYRFTDFPQ